VGGQADAAEQQRQQQQDEYERHCDLSSKGYLVPHATCSVAVRPPNLLGYLRSGLPAAWAGNERGLPHTREEPMYIGVGTLILIIILVLLLT
jgi:hypothetical protein